MSTLQTTSKRETAVAILTKGISGGDKEFLRTVVAETYIQHNPRVSDGREELLGLVDYLQSQGGSFTVEPVRVLVDGDMVAVHGRHTGMGESVAFDVFRFENGEAVEHWDGIQVPPEKTVSGRSMVDGPTEITDLDETEANREVVVNFYRDVLIDGNVEKLSGYLGSSYHQHNPGIADGEAGLMAFLSHLREQDIPFALNKTHRSIAEGNFVLLQSEGQIGDKPHVFYDLFRVEGGKIVEHWDVVQEIPSEMARNNGMF